MDRDELKKFEVMLKEKASEWEKQEGADAKSKGKLCRPTIDSVNLLLNYIAYCDEDPLSVDFEENQGIIGIRATFKGGKVKYFAPENKKK